jgi:hypothetical protein
MVEIGGKRGRLVWVDAVNIGADIGKETPAHGGGQTVTDLHDPEACQQCHCDASARDQRGKVPATRA